MGKSANVREETTAIAHTGRGVRIAAGVYEVVDIDGAADHGVTYLTGPDGLCAVNPNDPAITFEATDD